MVPATFHPAIGTAVVHECSNIPSSHEGLRNTTVTLVSKYCGINVSSHKGLSLGKTPVRLISKEFGTNIQTLSKGSHSCCWYRLHAIQACTSHISMVDPVSNSSHNVFCDSQKKSNEATLILLRHGESMWNEKNLFTGCTDVPLTKKGVEEAIEAGWRISILPVDIIYTSALIRAQMTVMLAMMQHHCKKVPIIVHNENEEANGRGLIYSDETKQQSIPVVTAWQLNERMYGKLQGHNKLETAEIYGKDQVHKWRRSYETCPPGGESLEICSQRAVSYFKSHIEPQLSSGKHVLVTAHANSLRAIIMYLDNLTPQEVINLELSTGIPMLYIYKEGKFIRRGSPLVPAEAGVYAHTKSLADYRQKIDEKLQ